MAPDRIVLKKIVLSGFPVRVKKRGGVVKHMFYNPDDVRWFRVRPPFRVTRAHTNDAQLTFHSSVPHALYM